MTSAPQSATTWMDPALAAAHIGFAPATLAKWRFQGGGPIYSRHHRSIRYNVAQLDQWLEAQTFDSTSQYARREATAT